MANVGVGATTPGANHLEGSGSSTSILFAKKCYLYRVVRSLVGARSVAACPLQRAALLYLW